MGVSQEPGICVSVDLHARTAALMLEKEPEHITPKERRLGKSMNNAVAMRYKGWVLGDLLGISALEALAVRDRFCATVLGVTPPGHIITVDELRQIARLT